MRHFLSPLLLLMNNYLHILLLCTVLFGTVIKATTTAFPTFVISKEPRTGEPRFRDLTVIEAPEPIGRIRLYLSSTQAESNNVDFDMYHLRARWTEPMYWNDNFDESARFYNLQCAVKDTETKEARKFLDVMIDWTYHGYDEKFRLPERKLLLRCRVSAVNSEKIRSSWTHTRTVYISLKRKMDDHLRLPQLQQQFTRRVMPRNEQRANRWQFSQQILKLKSAFSYPVPDEFIFQKCAELYVRKHSKHNDEADYGRAAQMPGDLQNTPKRRRTSHF